MTSNNTERQFEAAESAVSHYPGSPLASRTTALAPAFRSFEISRYSGDSAHSRIASSSGNDNNTSLSRSHSPSSTVGLSSAASSRPLYLDRTAMNRS